MAHVGSILLSVLLALVIVLLLKKSRLLALDPALKSAAIRPVAGDRQQRVGFSYPLQESIGRENDFFNSIEFVRRKGTSNVQPVLALIS